MVFCARSLQAFARRPIQIYLHALSTRSPTASIITMADTEVVAVTMLTLIIAQQDSTCSKSPVSKDVSPSKTVLRYRHPPARRSQDQEHVQQSEIDTNIAECKVRHLQITQYTLHWTLQLFQIYTIPKDTTPGLLVPIFSSPGKLSCLSNSRKLSCRHYSSTGRSMRPGKASNCTDPASTRITTLLSVPIMPYFGPARRSFHSPHLCISYCLHFPDNYLTIMSTLADTLKSPEPAHHVFKIDQGSFGHKSKSSANVYLYPYRHQSRRPSRSVRLADRNQDSTSEPWSQLSVSIPKLALHSVCYCAVHVPFMTQDRCSSQSSHSTIQTIFSSPQSNLRSPFELSYWYGTEQRKHSHHQPRHCGSYSSLQRQTLLRISSS